MDNIASKRVNRSLEHFENGVRGIIEEIGQLGERVVKDESLSPRDTHELIQDKIEALKPVRQTLQGERINLENNWVFSWKGKTVRYILYTSTAIAWFLQEGGDGSADIIDAEAKQGSSEDNESPFISAVSVKWCSKLTVYILAVATFAARNILFENEKALNKLKALNEEQIKELQQLSNWLELLSQVEAAKESSQKTHKVKRSQDLQQCLKNYDSLPKSIREKLGSKEIVTMRILNDFACNDLSIKKAYERIKKQARAKQRQERCGPEVKSKKKYGNSPKFGEQANRKKFDTSGKFRESRPAFLNISEMSTSEMTTSDESESDEEAYASAQLLKDYEQIANFAGSLEFIQISPQLAVDKNAEFWKPEEEYDEEKFGEESV